MDCRPSENKMDAYNDIGIIIVIIIIAVIKHDLIGFSKFHTCLLFDCSHVAIKTTGEQL